MLPNQKSVSHFAVISIDFFGGNMATLEGTEAADDLQGTPAADIIRGFGGDDSIDGGEGGDRIEAGPGDDRIFASFGADDIFGGFGDDTIQEVAGINFIDGGPGDDDIFLFSGRSNGGIGMDTLIGGIGNDTINIFLQTDSAEALPSGIVVDGQGGFDTFNARFDTINAGFKKAPLSLIKMEIASSGSSQIMDLASRLPLI